MSLLIDNHNYVLKQLKESILQLNQGQYSVKLDLLSGSSVGMHVRHIIEFYTCLLAHSGSVCYDERKRDITLEKSSSKAIEQIEAILESIRKTNLSTSILLKCNTSNTEESIEFAPSSIQREMIYVLDHTIHHMALIKIALSNQFPTVRINNKFGVAPSTVRFNKECAQ